MSLKEKIPMKSYSYAVRASQSVLQYGVGAMVDFPEQTLMTAAPEYWEESVVEIHDERLEKVLKVDFFGMPGRKEEKLNGISYARFPEWYFCPACRRFQPLNKWIKEYRQSPNMKKRVETDKHMVRHVRCPKCYQDLVVARIVSVCGHGHIDDFPWIKWVHARNQGGMRNICNNPTLTFSTTRTASEGLEGLTIKCVNCNSKATLAGAFDRECFEKLDQKTGGNYGFQCSGRHPWKNFKEPCGQYPRAMQRGSSSVYFPVSSSSLVIPPYSSKLTARVQDSLAFSDCKKAITESLKTMQSLGIAINQEMKDQVILGKVKEYASKISKEIGENEEQVKAVLERRWSGEVEEIYSTTSVKYRAEEYIALNGEVTVPDGELGEFVREDTNIAEYKIPGVKNISLIHKVREVQALTAFSRLEPIDTSDDESESKIKAVSVKEKNTNWYPGYEVRGEGIFIEFDFDAINRWRTNNSWLDKRVALLNDNYAKSFLGQKKPRVISGKFLLLHTLSHLLMKQLSFECGYSIASIKERLYCGEASDGKEMAGILIYTASGDSEGTMGGLVRQGRPDTFPKIFKKALDSAITCSNDPVCSLSMGQGRDSLNLSACYSCSLVPETSCEEFNVFLDRSVVLGTFVHREVGFYSEYVHGSGNVAPRIAKDEKKEKRQFPKKMVAYVTNPGTDLSSSSYQDIWESLIQFADDDIEKGLLNQLVEKADCFSGREKPCQGGSVQFGSEQIDFELAWKESKVLYFSADLEEEYQKAKDIGWKIFLGNDENCTWEKIYEVIREV